MRVSRRTFMSSTAAVSALAGGCSAPQPEQPVAAAARAPEPGLPPSIAALKPFPGTATPIADDERRARIEKARRLMTEQGLGAIVLEPGTSMSYFVDVRWGLSERPF